MDEVYKLPKIAFPEVTGSTVSFYSEYDGLPLKKCEVAINAWQEGSGDPSPENERPIHGFSEVNVKANNVVYTIQLGQDVYGAEVDFVNGVAHVTHKKEVFDGTQYVDLVNWRPKANSVGFSIYTATRAKLPTTAMTIANIMSDKLKSVSYDTIFSNNIDSIALYSRMVNTALFFRITDTSLTTKELVKTWLSNNNISVVYELANPFDIQLTPTQIETLIGNNTIFADTGDTTVQYIRVY